MPTTRLSDVYIGPDFTPTPGPPHDDTIRDEAKLRVLRSLAAKSPAHRARYEAALAELAKRSADRGEIDSY